VPAHEVIDISTDVTSAAMRVLALIRGWVHLRAHIATLLEARACVATTPRLQWCNGADPVAALQSIAEATLHAQSVYLTATPPQSVLVPTFKRASEMRKHLVGDAKTLERRHLLPRGSLHGLRRSKGYANVAADLTTLVTLFQTHWPTLHGKCAITHEELVTAERLAQTLIQKAQERSERAAHQTEATLLRARAFTVLHHAYGEVRRCIEFLEPNAHEALAPSLYKGRGRRTRSRLARSPDQEMTQPAPVHESSAIDT
jgi:hypothetical protein